VDVLDHGLQFSTVTLGDLASEDVVILLGWPMERLASRAGALPK